MNARVGAYERLGGRYEVRVLEPSPPTVSEPPWFADDPTARGDVPPGRRLVSPVSTGDLRWEDLAADDPELAVWCAERWLGSYRRLGPVPAELVSTRLALHRLGEHVVSPARRHVNGKIGLRYTRGGFGTPFYGDDVQVRVAGTELVVQQASSERRAPITSLATAADLVGRGGLPDDLELDERPLQIDNAAAIFLGDWYGFAASVLEQLRSEADARLEASRVQLWPEHFDMAIELGSEHAGARGVRTVPGRRAAPGAVRVRRAVGRTAGRRAVAGDRFHRRRVAVRRSAGSGEPTRDGARLPPRPARRPCR
jgi:hypothetical protein